MKETDAQAAICDYLALRKHLFWRANNVPVFDQARGGYRALPKYTMHGLPDIMVIKDGFFIALEVKTEKGRQSEAQKKFARLCKEHGGEYYVVHNISEVQEIGL